MREGGLEKMGIKLTMDETFTPPLADATLVVRTAQHTSGGGAVCPHQYSRSEACAGMMNEMGLGRGRIPMIGNGAPMGAPEMLQVVGKDLMEGVLIIIANWTQKGQETLTADFKKRTGEPWMTQDSLCSYGDMWIFKEALKKAGAADRRRSPMRFASWTPQTDRPSTTRAGASSSRTTAACGCGDYDHPMAERRAGDGLSDRHCAGEAGVAQEVTGVMYQLS